MNIDQITALLRLGQLSLDLHAANQAADAAKRAYHQAWRVFECEGDPEECDPDAYRIMQGHPQWDAAVAHTAREYAAYQAARRAAYNTKRRWVNACRRAHSIHFEGL